jgi:hypothetical protein
MSGEGQGISVHVVAEDLGIDHDFKLEAGERRSVWEALKAASLSDIAQCLEITVNDNPESFASSCGLKTGDRIVVKVIWQEDSTG